MKIVDLSKTYNEGIDNETKALKNVNLKFNNKGLIFIVGKSGSGKTTLLNILAGLDTPTSGFVEDNGTIISNLTPSDLNLYRKNNIGFIFQNYSLIGELTVKENVLMGMEETQYNLKRMREILDKLDLNNCEEKIASQLSGGQQQRVAIARALLKESKVILADEPTGNLDQYNSQIVFEILKRISRDRLVIVITHDEESAEKYGDQIITITDGVVKKESLFLSEGQNCGVIIDSDKRQKISFKRILKCSRRLIRKYRVRLIVSSALSVVMLALFGICMIFNRFDFCSTSAKILKDNRETYINVYKGYVDEKTGFFQCANRVISKEEANQFIEENTLEDVDLSYLLIGMFFSNGDSGNPFLRGNIGSAIVSSEKGLDKYGFSLKYGKYPTKKREIAVTDYLLYDMYVLSPYLVSEKLGWKNLDLLDDNYALREALKNQDKRDLELLFGKEWKEAIKDDANLKTIQENPGLLLINSDIEFSEGTYSVTGVIGTDFEEKYKDLIYMSTEKMLSDPRTDTFNYLTGTIYSSFYVSEAFIDEVYKNIIIFNNAAVCKYSEYKDTLGLTKELDYGQAYVSSNYFRQYFKEEFDKSKVGSYLIPNTTTMTLGEGMEPDTIFESDDLEVVGVFDIPADYSEKLSSSMAMIVEDKYFDEYTKSQSYIYGISFPVVNGLERMESILRNMESKEYYYSLPYSYSMYETKDIMHIFKDISWILFIVIISISTVLTANTFCNLIKDQSVNIGIMRALGLDVNEVLKMYFIGIIDIIIIIPILSCSVMYFTNEIVNGVIVRNLTRFFNEEYISNMHLLNISVIPIITIIVSYLLIIFMSMLCTTYKLTKVDPIKIIRS